MRILALVVLIILTLGFWLGINQKSDTGKNPKDEEVIFTQERNRVTGQLLNVEIVRCKICGEIISYIQYGLSGKVVAGYVHVHSCGKYGDHPLVRYIGTALGPSHFNLIEWLDKWQKRLHIQR